MVGHGGSSAGSYLADPTSPIPSHCASIVATSTLRVKKNNSATNARGTDVIFIDACDRNMSCTASTGTLDWTVLVKITVHIGLYCTEGIYLVHRVHPQNVSPKYRDLHKYTHMFAPYNQLDKPPVSKYKILTCNFNHNTVHDTSINTTYLKENHGLQCAKSKAVFP